MKLKSYNTLFRIFSFLSDKTNGAPIFVKYKLLLGTVILGLISSSVKAQTKTVAGDTLTVIPIPEIITCYKPVFNPIKLLVDSIEVRGNITEVSGEPLIGVSIRIKNGSPRGVLTDIDGNFSLNASRNDIITFTYVGFEAEDILASEIDRNKPIVMTEDLSEISCYVLVTAPLPERDDIYARTPKKTEVTPVTTPQSNKPEVIKISGNVKELSGEPLMGVNVRIKSAPQTGTITDIDGSFTLETKKHDTLVFSFIGMETKEIPVSEIIDGKVAVILKDDGMILCYDVVIISGPERDDIYRRTPKKITKLAYNEVDTNPVSPVGNIREFEDWVQKNILYTQQMQKDKVQGQVILSFAVDKNGKVTDKKVIAKLSKEADKEALRVLSSSEKWTPGRHNNKPIKTTMTITVYFGAQ